METFGNFDNAEPQKHLGEYGPDAVSPRPLSGGFEGADSNSVDAHEGLEAPVSNPAGDLPLSPTAAENAKDIEAEARSREQQIIDERESEYWASPEGQRDRTLTKPGE